MAAFLKKEQAAEAAAQPWSTWTLHQLASAPSQARAAVIGLIDWARFTPLKFDVKPPSIPEDAPKPPGGTTEYLSKMVDLIEKHAKGFYENDLKKYHKAGKGLTEADSMVDPDTHAYEERPDGPIKEMEALLDSVGKDYQVVITAALMQMEKSNGAAAVTVAQEYQWKDSNLNLKKVMKSIDPICSHYLKKRANPDEHKVPGVEYEPDFMNRRRSLEPSVSVMPLLVTHHLAYHASVGTLLKTARKKVFPPSYTALEGRFHDTRVAAHKNSYNISMGKPGSVPGFKPEYLPDVPLQSFYGTQISSKSTIGTTLIAVPTGPEGALYETFGSYAKHPENNLVVTEFRNPKDTETEYMYAITTETPPLLGKRKIEEAGQPGFTVTQPALNVFTNAQEAEKRWNSGLRPEDQGVT